MKETLRLFANSNLFDASKALLNILELKYKTGAEKSWHVEKLFENKTLSNAEGEALSLLSDIYFVAKIDDRTFNDNSGIIELDSAIHDAQEEKYKGLFVFACDIPQKKKVNRTTVTSLTRAFNKLAANKPVVLIIRQGEELSLSICERTSYTVSQNYRVGEKLGRVTILRGINCNDPHRALIDILLELNAADCSNFDDLYRKWMTEFDISLLNKQFYKELQKWFYWAVEVIKLPQIIDSNQIEDQQAKYFIVRMLSRLIFCWFMKERGLIDNQLLELTDIKNNRRYPIVNDLDDDNFLDSNSYYRGILQNMFFNGLNKQEKSSSKDFRFMRYLPDDFEYDRFIKLPFLNCGTFDPLEEDFNKESIEDEVLSIPNRLFYGDANNEGINQIFCNYHFTVEENTPLDIDIALDPEMLGLVFENLLAEIDPRTKNQVRETIKKARGAYHTPDCILDEMVKDSLSRYLISKLSNPIEKQDVIKSFVYELVYNGKKVSNLYDSDCVKALYSISVLDPACGSGSFPLNVLNNMDRILSILDPQSELWKSFVLKSILDKKVRNNMEKQLTGLIQDDKRSYTRKLILLRDCIFGLDIQPLAIYITRLRFYLSLMTEQKVDFSAPNLGIVSLPYLDTKFMCVDSLKTCNKGCDETTAKKLISERVNCFDATNKDLYTKALESISCVVSNVLACNNIISGKEDVCTWLKNPQKNLDLYKTSLLFPEVRNGFDIVIGNPPFGALMSESEIETYKNEYSSTKGESAIFFIKMGIRELKPKGTLSFLVPKPLSYASNYKELREELKNELTLLVDCGKAFKDVKFEQSIIGLCKGDTSSSYLNKKYDKRTFVEISNIDKSNIDTFKLFLNDVSNPEITIANKMKNGSTDFGDISTNTRGKGLQNQLYKLGKYPVYGGKEISRYGITTPKGFINEPIGGDAEVLPNSLLFQNIVAHIMNPYPHVKLIGCLSPKSKAYIVDTVNQIVVKDGYSPEYIWGLLNSKLLSWYVYCFIYGRAIRTMHFDMVATKRIPIKKTEDYSKLVKHVNKIRRNVEQGLSTKDLENELDMWVYKIYGLKYEQCLIIDPLLTFTEEEFNTLK